MLHDDEIAALRREYRAARLDEDAVAHEPIAQFRRWFDDAVQTAEGEPNAMTLATVSPDGRPAARVVLLKGVEEEADGGGFLFFTNYGSDKGRAMAANPAVALVFFWHALERQVRVEGRVEKVSRAESEAYFAKRPRGSQLGAVASPQSAPVASRAVLEARLAEAEARFAGAEVACPEDWGGYRVVPSRVEFWQGRESRLHDRIVYARSATGWSLSRLGP